MYFVSLSILWKTVSKGLAGIFKMHCSPFLDQASQLIREGIKLGIFPLHKSMLTPPNPPVTPHLFGSIFQVYLLHHLLRDQDEADQPLVLCALHLDIFGRGSGIFYLYFFQSSRTFLITAIFRILLIVSWQCHQPSHSAMHLVKSHKLVSVQSI